MRSYQNGGAELKDFRNPENIFSIGGLCKKQIPTAILYHQ